jgi:hypothetical protein
MEETLVRQPARGLKLSLSSIGRLLKQLGLTCQRPLYLPSQQHPERVRGETE